MTDPVQNPYISPESIAEDAPGGSLSEFVRPGQIITFALVQGVLVITAILFLFIKGEAAAVNPAAPNAPTAGGGDLVLPGIGIVAAVGACVIAFALRTMLRRTSINKYRKTETKPQEIASQDASLTPAMRQLMKDSQVGTLIGQVILEGAAVMNAILMVVDDNIIHLVPIAILVAGIVIQLPTVGKKRQLAKTATDDR